MKLSRRQFLAVTATATAGLGLARLSATGAAGKSKKFKYKGRDVEIEDDQTFMVMINGKHQHHIKKLGDQRYVSHLLPFNEYSDAESLVKALIDMEDQEMFVL